MRFDLHPEVLELARHGLFTGASGRNWESYGQDVTLDAALGDVEKALLTDPQTSGGLLVACAQPAVEEVLALFASQGFAQAAVIGEIAPGTPRVSVN
jgi:selenide,water dikinase